MPAASNNPHDGTWRKPILCYVTGRKSLDLAVPADALLGIVELEKEIHAAVDAGVDWVQIREKDLPGREMLALVRKAAALGRAKDGRVIVNDRLDVALAAGATGVHLGRESLPAQEVVAWRRAGNAPAGFLIGVSCHSLKEARAAELAGASYIFFGPVFDTPSKQSFGAPQGLARLSEVCRSVAIPVIAIGGISQANGLECLQAGGAGIAAIRLFQAARKSGELEEIIARLHGSASD